MKKSLLVVLAAAVLVAVVSVVVWQSSGDAARRQGALESRDATALAWRGAWTERAEYAVGNVVVHEGATYVADSEKLGQPQAECEECGWVLLASESTQALQPPPPPPTMLKSPDGRFKVEVANTGILLSGPGPATVSLQLTADSLKVQMPNEIQLKSGAKVAIESGGILSAKGSASLALESSGTGSFKSSILSLGCASGGQRVARVGDLALSVPNGGQGPILTGSTTVFAC